MNTEVRSMIEKVQNVIARMAYANYHKEDLSEIVNEMISIEDDIEELLVTY